MPSRSLCAWLLVSLGPGSVPHVKEYGLRSAYIQQLTIRTYISKRMALPNIPAMHIEPAFILKTWITSSSRPPAPWTTFKWSVRTNNDAEGWHSRLNHNATHDHLSFYLLVQTCTARQHCNLCRCVWWRSENSTATRARRR